MTYELLYYSGAGNTELLSKILEQELLKRDHQVNRSRLRKDSAGIVQDDFGALGIGFPVHFRDAPRLVYDGLSKLQGRGRGIFVFCTKGLYSGNAVRNVSLFAEERGFELRGFLEITMPGTDGLILFARKGSITERCLKAMKSRHISDKAERFIARLESGSKANIPAEKWYSGIDESVVHPLENRFSNQHRNWIGLFHSMADRCTRCGLCVRECPQENISMTEQGVEFGLNCDVCFRCIHRCPTEAIQIGDRTLLTTRYRPERDLRIDRSD